MKSLIKFTAIGVTVLFIACGKGSPSQGVVTQDVQLPAKQEESTTDLTTADTAGIPAKSKEVAVNAGAPFQTPEWDKKIIKTADVTLELKNYNAFNNLIHTGIKRYGAYIASEQQNESDTKIENTISIKVLVEQFENLMIALPSEEAKVIGKRITTEDVTSEMVDTKARIEARKQVRGRYLDLLKQAKTMKEVLEVEREVNSIQEEIEAGAGRVQYLAHQAAYSTINLTYFQYITGNSIESPTPAFVSRLVEAFKEGASIIASLLLGLVTIWPLIAIAVVTWMLIKKQRASKVGKTAIPVSNTKG